MNQYGKKKKVLFFIEDLGCGGAEKSLLALLQTIDYSRVDVDLMTLFTIQEPYASYVPREVKVINLPRMNALLRIRHKICMSAFSVGIRLLPSFRKRHGAEVRWMFECSALPKLDRSYDVAIAYQQGMPTYYIASCVDATTKIGWVNVDLKGAGYDEDFNRKFYNRLDKIVAVSDKLYYDLLKLSYFPHDRMYVMYDMLNVPQIRDLAMDGYHHPQTKSLVNLVTVGRMAKQKNYLLAVSTARLLRDRGINFTWIFVGGGGELEMVKDLIKESNLEDMVIPVGEQSNPYPYMRAADIYVHTASFEGYGLTIAEAKILGKPVVSTNFQVVYDQITDGVNGLIAEMTPESVADKIIRLIEDRNLMSEITQNINKENNITAQTEIVKFYKLIDLDVR